ncbi:MAG: Smr/MutS family protein [bacterium]
MRSWQVVDFPRAREMLVANCRTPMGVELASQMRPFATRPEAEGELDRLAEVVALESVPELGPGADARPLIERSRTGGVLTGGELLAVGRSAEALAACRRFLDGYRSALPLLSPELEAIGAEDDLAAEIALALDESGEVVDSASDALARVRRELRGLRARVVGRLEEMLAEHPDWYGERPTVRHDRLVVPVRLEHRDRVAGVVHESSGTGRTLFVEPMPTVGDQNRAEELRGREAEEVARVLRRLSELVAGRADPLGLGLAALGRLDFLLAKRRFVEEFDCARPALTERRVRVRSGRHPILLRRRVRVVPLDLDLSDDAGVLLISGPNAGGKTVVLKTLGLFCLLAASGVFVPAARGTELPFYRQVFADIGDDQSLDADLSSFTAHVGKLKLLLEEADAGSLVLLDEVGAATSPEEGAALAIAVLETLHERGVRVIATSHLWALKLFVQDHPQMVNAAMGMADSAPTYRLTIGLPGESSALEVAAAAGLPEELLGRARVRVGQDWVDLAGRLRELERELEAVRCARAEVERQLAITIRTRAEYETKLAALQAEAGRERERSVVRQRRMLDEARREIENLVRDIRESQASHEAIVRAKRAVEERMRTVDAEAGSAARAVLTDVSGAAMPAAGDVVRSRALRQSGRVESLEGTEAVVAFGSVRVRLPASDLERVEGARLSEPAETGWQEMPAGPAARLNLLGRTREEALEQLEGYLAEAAATGLAEARILHGKGEGVLQRAVWSALRRDARVGSFRFAEPGEGGTGVTVVELRTGQA